MSVSHWSDDDFYEAFTLPADDDPSSIHSVDAANSQRESNKDNITQEGSKSPEMITSAQQENQSSVTKEAPDKIQIKESFAEEQFCLIHISIRQTRGRPCDTPKSIPNRYDSLLPVSVQKKKDLMSLCDSLVIPEHYRCFYEGLKTSKTMKDRLPEPDILEEEEDSD